MSPTSPLLTEIVAAQPDAARPEPSQRPPARSIHVVDADLATFELIREWLEPEGWRVIERIPERTPELAPGLHATADDCSLVIVDLAYPRDAHLPALVRLREALPGVPLLVMSPTIFEGVGCCGPCARQLGVAGVLPKPVSRAALVAAIASVALHR